MNKSNNISVKTKLFFILRKLGGHRLPMSIKKPVGEMLILNKNAKSEFYEQRRHTVAELLELTEDVEGDTAECGVAEGFTTIIMTKKLKDMNQSKKLYAIDYFDQLPYDDNDYPFKRKGLIKKKFTYNKLWIGSTFEEVQQRFENEKLDNIILLKSLVEDVLPTLSDKKFSFVNVDVNSYKTTKLCLEFFKDRISKNGIIFLDDYNQVGWQGATLHVMKY